MAFDARDAATAGLANLKAVHIEAATHEKKIALAVTMKQSKQVRMPAKNAKKSVIARDARKALASVGKQIEKYRPDLKVRNKCPSKLVDFPMAMTRSSIKLLVF